MPVKTKYSAGEELSFDGLSVTLAGQDVTSQCAFEPAEGSAWKKNDSEVIVKVSHPQASDAEFTLKKKRGILPIVVILLILAAVAGGAAWYLSNQDKPEADTGTHLIPQGNMTQEEAQQLVNDMAEKSRITISVSPNMRLKDDGQLRVNFIVPEDNNGFSERLEVEQNGRIVYASGIVAPGYRVEWGQSEGAEPGPATATIYAVSGEADSGNPVSAEIQIVAASDTEDVEDNSGAGND